MRDLRRLPKTDLHIHLEGAIRPATLRDLALRNGRALPPALSGDTYAFRDSDEFFELNGLVRDCLADAADFHRVAYELCEDLAAQGIRYAEVSFTLGTHAARLGDWDMPLEAALAGLADGRSAFGVTCGLVLDNARKRPVELAWQTLRVAERRPGQGIVGFGLAGREDYPALPFAEVFRAARTVGLHAVPHAGEMRGPESIREALDVLGAERIGHGIGAVQDRALLVELRERAIPLEVCPGSNVALGLVPSLAAHPLPRLLAAGVTAVLCSDVPALFGSPLLGEYEATRHVFGLDDHALADLARGGIRASFADDATKADLLRDVDAWVVSPD